MPGTAYNCDQLHIVVGEIVEENSLKLYRLIHWYFSG
jgi:hypothetical protein